MSDALASSSPRVPALVVARAAPFFLAFVVPAICGAAVMLRGPWLWLPPAFLFLITPLLDALLGKDTAAHVDDPTVRTAADALRVSLYEAVPWLWLPLQGVVLWAALDAVGHIDGVGGFVGLAFAAGLQGAIGINVAHELMHRRSWPARAAAEALCTSTLYAHFCVEHVLGHHKNVATPLDAATARRGDNVYAFVPRSVWHTLRSAFHLEGERLRRLGGRPPWADRRVRMPLIAALALCMALWLAGPVGLALFVAQAAVAVFLLESINFIEHYGLSRRELAPGVYERVTPAHSWSSAHRLTSWYLINLPRHADHHAHAARPYWALRHVEEGPQMPAGYGTMLVLSWCPPLWRRVMHPRLADWQHRLAREAPTEPGGPT
jgi:alkane 1-monooxygenase